MRDGGTVTLHFTYDKFVRVHQIGITAPALAAGDANRLEGEVLVFELPDHPTARRCYVWEVGGEVTAALEVGRIDSPAAAVRASILAEG